MTRSILLNQRVRKGKKRKLAQGLPYEPEKKKKKLERKTGDAGYEYSRRAKKNEKQRSKENQILLVAFFFPPSNLRHRK